MCKKCVFVKTVFGKMTQTNFLHVSPKNVHCAIKNLKLCNKMPTCASLASTALALDQFC